jgi:hypothetical protein
VAATERAISSSKRHLFESDRLIASLGRCLEEENPAEARSLLRWVEARLPAWASLAPRRRRAWIARERLLTRQRLDEEFERGDVILIDGWVLARSEGALAVYLSSLAPHGGPLA